MSLSRDEIVNLLTARKSVTASNDVETFLTRLRQSKSTDHTVWTSVDDEGFTLLHVACMYRHSLPTIEALISPCILTTSPPLNATEFLLRQERYGNTALHLACRYQAPLPVIQYLLQMCPQAAAMQNHAGETPLHRTFCHAGVASRTPSLSLIQELIAACPKALCLTNQLGETPLHCACSKFTLSLSNHSHVLIIQELLNQDPQGVVHALLCRDSLGNTPLHRACVCSPSALSSSSSVMVLKVLLDAVLFNKETKTSEVSSCQAALKSLLELPNHQKETPLHVACRQLYPQFPVIRLLFTYYGMRKDEKDDSLSVWTTLTNQFHQTPLHLLCASSSLSLEIVDFVAKYTPKSVWGMPDHTIHRWTPLALLLNRLSFPSSDEEEDASGTTTSMARLPPSEVAWSSSFHGKDEGKSMSSNSFTVTGLLCGVASTSPDTGTATKQAWVHWILRVAQQWPAACLMLSHNTGSHSHQQQQQLPMQQLDLLRGITQQALAAWKHVLGHPLTTFPPSLFLEIMSLRHEDEDWIRSTSVQSILSDERYQSMVCGLVQLHQAQTKSANADDPPATIRVLGAVSDNLDCLLMHLLSHPTLCRS